MEGNERDGVAGGAPVRSSARRDGRTGGLTSGISFRRYLSFSGAEACDAFGGQGTRKRAQVARISDQRCNRPRR